jgi:hypothetical protein
VNQPGYNPGANYTLTIGKASQTIAFGTLPAKTVGDAAFNLSASATSGGTVVFTSSNPAVATVSGITVTVVGPGTTTITAAQAGNTNYLAANSVGQNLTVAAAGAGDGGDDVPVMPPWALASLAVLLAALTVPALARRRNFSS